MRKTTNKRAVVTQKYYRLPRLSLACIIEHAVMFMVKSGQYLPFYYPVPRDTPNYYERILQPICLQEIREKISQFQYHTLASFFDDLDTMCRNAETYNGYDSVLSKLARTLVNKIKRLLDNEKEKIKILEEAIHKK